MRPIAILLCGFVFAGCGGRESSSLRGTTLPVSDAEARRMAAQDRDCLQYPVGTDSTGAEVWYADWVFFSLVRYSDSLLAKNPDGTPIAVNLLHSQVEDFMARRQPISGTGWTYVVQRARQRVSSGKVVGVSPYQVVEDADLDSLLAWDRSARGREPAVLPPTR